MSKNIQKYGILANIHKQNVNLWLYSFIYMYAGLLNSRIMYISIPKAATTIRVYKLNYQSIDLDKEYWKTISCLLL